MMELYKQNGKEVVGIVVGNVCLNISKPLTTNENKRNQNTKTIIAQKSTKVNT